MGDNQKFAKNPPEKTTNVVKGTPRYLTGIGYQWRIQVLRLRGPTFFRN